MDTSKRKLFRMSNTCSYLPEELIWNILLRLSVKDITRFKHVSKTWMSLITNPSFVEAVCHKHLEDNEEELIFVLADPVGTKSDYNYFSLNLDKEIATPKELLGDITPRDLGVNPKELFLWSSCSGLLLFEHIDRKNNLYILNPLTAELAALPPLERNTRKFLGRWTLIKDTCVKKFKVYGIFSHGKYLVLTQGDTKWTEVDIPKISHRELCVLSQQPLFANRELHWLTLDEDPEHRYYINPVIYYILSIHVETGKLTRTKVPFEDIWPARRIPKNGDYEHLLTEVNGSLCFVIVTERDVLMFIQEKVSCNWTFTPSFDRVKRFKWNEIFPSDLKKFISKDTCIIARRGTNVDKASQILNFVEHQDGWSYVSGTLDILKLLVYHDGWLFIFDFKDERWRKIPFPKAKKEQTVKTYYSVFHSNSLDSWKTSSCSWIV